MTFQHADMQRAERELEVRTGTRSTLEVSLTHAIRAPREVVFVGDDGTPSAVEYSITSLGARAHVSGETGADGIAQLTNWPTGATSITVFGGNHAQQTARVRFDAEQQSARLVLRRGTGEITGHVLRPDGQPIVNEIVVLKETAEGGLRVYDEVFTGQAGDFRFTGLPATKYTLDVSNDVRTRLEVRPGAGPITLRFPAR